MATDLRISVPAEDAGHKGVPEVGDLPEFLSGSSGSGVMVVGGRIGLVNLAGIGSPTWSCSLVGF
jgi:hypothetical protein